MRDIGSPVIASRASALSGSFASSPVRSRSNESSGGSTAHGDEPYQWQVLEELAHVGGRLPQCGELVDLAGGLLRDAAQELALAVTTATSCLRG